MKKYILLLAITLLFMGSCSSEDNIGKISEIGIERTELNVSEKENIYTIKTKVGSWELSQVVSYEENEETIYKNELYLQEDSKGNTMYVYKDMIHGEWFTITKKNEKLEIKIMENFSSKERKIVITLAGSVGYFSADLTVIQSSNPNM